MKDNEVYIGCFERELKEDFYFYNTFDKKIWKLSKPEDKDLIVWEREVFNSREKILVPMKSGKLHSVWEDKPYQELPNKSFSAMNLREYACIHLGVPESGEPWLDELIRKSGSHAAKVRTTAEMIGDLGL